jgi:hypothetical protein
MPAVRLLWIAGFLVGTGTHVLDIVAGGAEVYAGYPAAVRVFWLSLTVVDPLVAGLLVFRRPAGVVLGLAVMVADMAVNWTVHATVGGGSMRALLTLTAFMVFVLATARPLARWLARPRPER